MMTGVLTTSLASGAAARRGPLSGDGQTFRA